MKSANEWSPTGIGNKKGPTGRSTTGIAPIFRELSLQPTKTPLIAQSSWLLLAPFPSLEGVPAVPAQMPRRVTFPAASPFLAMSAIGLGGIPQWRIPRIQTPQQKLPLRSDSSIRAQVLLA